MNPFERAVAEIVAPQSGLDAAEVARLLEVPRDPKLGDYAFPCFQLAKREKKAPPVIAADLAKRVEPKGLVLSVEAAGPYVNFRVDGTKRAALVLGAVLKEGGRYGESDEGKGRTVAIDFSSPNIAKPFSIAHLRSTVIGHALYNVHRALGWTCVGINHLGDWGTQFGKMMVAYRRWWDSMPATETDPVRKLLALYVRFHEEAERDKSLEEEGRAWFKKLEDGEKEARDLWKRLTDLSLKEFQRIYDRLGIRFDHFTGEAFYNDKLDAALEKIEAKGITKISEGALVVDLEEWGMPPALLRKSDDATLYMTRDLAALEYRHDQYRFDRALYVVGSDQILHFRQLFKVAELMGWTWAEGARHVNFGLYRFKEGKMSTRQGRVVFLEEVLDRAVELAAATIREKNPDLKDAERIAEEVGLGAVVFNDLKTGRTKDVVFDWEQVLSFEGRTGPYLQYTAARIASILRKHGAPPDPGADLSLLAEPEEKEIVRSLERFPSAIAAAAEECEPSKLANALLDLGEFFNAYYNRGNQDASLRVLTPDERMKSARIVLAAAVLQVMKKGLDLLGMRTPEEM